MCLADCHNPAHGCFPTQAFIAEDCEISRRSVNTHLDTLEARGLILRLTSIDEQTRRQRPTRYYLAFEDGFAVAFAMAGKTVVAPVEKAASRVQDLHTEPCAKSAKSRVQNLHTNPVKKKNRNARAHTRESGPVENLPVWQGDETIRERVADDPHYGENFAKSYIDTARPGPAGEVIARTRIGFEKLRACEALRGVRILGPPS